ncbi:hypothetical protein AKJ09_05022 [Labilithrix luteola]|uniref:Uncharacterized protein n=1 Tax=Labilithrix luteola TaxID=1391654 RepID=A0A0K1PXV3_9BACT|nr:hypothetical protein AKJ09_05022 [Labilithrix luteola]
MTAVRRYRSSLLILVYTAGAKRRTERRGGTMKRSNSRAMNRSLHRAVL